MREDSKTKSRERSKLLGLKFRAGCCCLICCSGLEAGGELVSAVPARPGLLSITALRFRFLVGNGEITLVDSARRWREG